MKVDSLHQFAGSFRKENNNSSDKYIPPAVPTSSATALDSRLGLGLRLVLERYINKYRLVPIENIIPRPKRKSPRVCILSPLYGIL